MILYTMAVTEKDIELPCNSGIHHNIICQKILLLLSVPNRNCSDRKSMCKQNNPRSACS